MKTLKVYVSVLAVVLVFDMADAYKRVLMKNLMILLFVALLTTFGFGQGFTMNTTGPDETSAVLLNRFGQLLQIGIPYESGLGNLSENLKKPCKFRPDGARGSVQVCTSLGITYFHANSVAWPFFKRIIHLTQISGGVNVRKP